jgi:hypothetical protein
MSDIRFAGDDVHAEGSVLKVTCFDVELDNAGRRRSGGAHRRALVHDFTDGLTLNWDNDYPGGVTINGDLRVPDQASVERLNGEELRCTHHTLHLNNFTRRTPGPVRPGKTSIRKTLRRALVHDTTDGLTINFNKDYPGGVTIRGVVQLPERLVVQNQDLLQVIAALQAQVAALDARVQTLEAST